MDASSSSSDLGQLRDAAARRFGTRAAVHPDDLLWDFIAGHSLFPTLTEAADYYFSDGAESARKLAELIDDLFGRTDVSVMEFASGYGMVSRHLRGALPGAEIASCDIHPEAVSFVRERLGVASVLSADVPEELDFRRKFDVVFALSFFSHMPESSFGRWLAALHRQVRPDGFLIFTTHGLASAPALGSPEIPESGFWFRPDSEQRDLEGALYGSTISTTDYVVSSIYGHTRAPIVRLRSAYWWQHQDLYVVAGPHGPQTPAPTPFACRAAAQLRSRVAMAAQAFRDRAAAG